jgi:hypothetical protein
MGAYDLADLGLTFILGAAWGGSGVVTYQTIRRMIERRRRERAAIEQAGEAIRNWYSKDKK